MSESQKLIAELVAMARERGFELRVRAMVSVGEAGSLDVMPALAAGGVRFELYAVPIEAGVGDDRR